MHAASQNDEMYVFMFYTGRSARQFSCWCTYHQALTCLSALHVKDLTPRFISRGHQTLRGVMHEVQDLFCNLVLLSKKLTFRVHLGHDVAGKSFSRLMDEERAFIRLLCPEVDSQRRFHMLAIIFGLNLHHEVFQAVADVHIGRVLISTHSWHRLIFDFVRHPELITRRHQ